MIDPAKTIKVLRLRSGLSQRGLCRVVGIGTNVVHNYEKGAYAPNVYTFEDILNALGYHLEIAEGVGSDVDFLDSLLGDHSDTDDNMLCAPGDGSGSGIQVEEDVRTVEEGA